MKRAFGAAAVIAVVALVPQAYAYQDSETWEFHFFGGSSAFDNAGLFEISSATTLDADGDGTLETVRFQREVTIEDDTFSGFRLGFNWTSQIGSEFSYDKNRTHADYRHRFDDGTSVENVQGGASFSIASYQIGLLYHPLGKWKTPFQPYATLGAGYVDASIDPSESTRAAIAGSVAAQNVKVEFTTDDQSWLVLYGLGFKYYFSDAVGVRAEARGKSSDLFDQRRDDLEWSLGLSIFVPSLKY